MASPSLSQLVASLSQTTSALEAQMARNRDASAALLARALALSDSARRQAEEKDVALAVAQEQAMKAVPAAAVPAAALAEKEAQMAQLREQNDMLRAVRMLGVAGDGAGCIVELHLRTVQNPQRLQRCERDAK